MVTVALLSAASVIGIVVIRYLSEWLSRRDHDRDFAIPSHIAIGDEL